MYPSDRRAKRHPRHTRTCSSTSVTPRAATGAMKQALASVSRQNGQRHAAHVRRGSPHPLRAPVRYSLGRRTPGARTARRCWRHQLRSLSQADCARHHSLSVQPPPRVHAPRSAGRSRIRDRRLALTRGALPLLLGDLLGIASGRDASLRRKPPHLYLSPLLVKDLVRLAVDAFLILLGQVAGLLRLSGA